MLKVSSKAGSVGPFIVMDVMRAANAREAAGETVLHLEVGQPHASAPAGVIAAAHQALDRDRLGYTDALGIPPLRQRIAQYYQECYGREIAPDRVAVTTGSSGGFQLAFLAAFDPGDRVALAAPGYPAYRNILTALGMIPVEIETDETTRFQPTPNLLDAIDPGIDGLIIASPSNPTGTMLAPDELRAIAEWCQANGVRLISDEIYHNIVFGVEQSTAVAFDDQAIVVNSFSKYFAMTGWRLGWLLMPEDLVRPIERLAQNLFISAPTVSQVGGVAAFDCREELDAVVEGYHRNRDLLWRELPRAGFDKLAPPDGAFYLFADVGHLTNDSKDFCHRMLVEAGVAATPGIDFDPRRGSRFVRFSYARSLDDMAAAVRHLGEWIGRR